jgi:TatD DNase family protein
MTLAWFDTHCHLDAPGHDRPPADLLAEARAVGVQELVLPAVEPDNWPTCARLAQEHQGVYPAFGVHPQAVRDLSDDALTAALDALPRWLAEHHAVAVGECGLDHRWDADSDARARQRQTFLRHLDAAHALRLPPLIHCLGPGAYELLLKLWRAHPCRAVVPGVLHSYSGSAQMVPLYVKENLYVSFSGTVTWANAKRAPEACLAVPDERLLLETDAPYQPPHPLDDRPNHPARLPEIAARVAQLRGTSLETLSALTTRNARALFLKAP